MHLLSSITATIQKYQMLSSNDHILVAVSGGADSIALLYCLLELRKSFPLSLSVCHLNHNLRAEESQKDSDFVQELCQTLGLPLFSYSADVLAKGRSLEEAARHIRYSFLYKAAKKCKANKIALGHNQNDNVETLLLRLCRGTGLSGMCAIPPVREGEGATIIRPLIETSRVEIESYLNQSKIPFRTDVSNFDRAFTRNKIRHDVMPKLQQINPQASSHIARSIERLREDEEILSGLCNKILEDCLSQEGEKLLLHIPSLLNHSKALQKRLIHAALHRFNSLRNISAAHISQIEHLLYAESGKESHLPFGLCARRQYDHLLILPKKAVKNQAFCHDVPIDKPIYIPSIRRNVQASILSFEKIPCPIFSLNVAEMCTKYFNYDKIKGKLQLRSRKPGDRISLAGLGRKKLKDELSDRKIPQEQRDSIPLLAVDSDILWIIHRHNRSSGAYLPEPGCKILAVTVY